MQSLLVSPAGTGPFDFSQPAFRLSPDPPGQQLFNLSGLDIYGAHCLARHWALALASSFLLGLKGPVIGAGIWIVWQYMSHGSGALYELQLHLGELSLRS